VAPDLTTALPPVPFEFSPGVRAAAARLVSGPPEALFRRLVRDQEAEPVLLAARLVIAAFLPPGEGAAADGTDDIAAAVAAVRAELTATIDSFARLAPDIRAAVVRQRAPLALTAGCWLDTVSQPATQPAVIVNHLFRHHFQLMGAGNPHRSAHHARRRAMEQAGVDLPDIDAADFLARAGARPLTSWHACFHVALSRLPASFLPEVVGVHYAYHAIGVDDLLTSAPPVLSGSALRALLAQYLGLTARATDRTSLRHRLRRAVDLVCALEREHVTMLAELATWLGGRSLDARVAAIIARHAPYAGRQHGNVRVHGRPLTETFAAPDFDVVAFLTELRNSRQVKPLRTGDCRFLRAIRFGGPMFGIFDEHEAATFAAWVAAVQAGTPPEPDHPVNRVGDDRARRWGTAVGAAAPDDVVFADADPRGDRELFHRLVNIEHHPNTLPIARERVHKGLADAEVLFRHGARGRYTDASWLDYTPEALLARVEAIYWDKLVNPYRPLERIPDRDEVVFHQTTFALGNLIDGAWSHRIANLGRYRRRSDALMFGIYADEMGRGDLRKNHLTLIHRVLAAMSVRVPHIRDAAFLDQDELPDGTYDSAVHQMCLSLFPDSRYPEILGYNLAIEMYGLGELRLHEIQKLRYHGLDASYEEAHLSIDNLSAGHARQAAQVIVAYLDDVERERRAAVPDEWRRVWRGYASFAYFAEHRLIADLSAEAAAAGAPAGPAHAELII
jgi:hypothetical protein